MSAQAAVSMRRAHEAQRRTRGVSIVYFRGEASLGLVAIPGRHSRSVTVDYGVIYDEDKHKDWLVLTGELLLDGEHIKPERGDIIQDGPTRYAVAADQGDAHWRFADPYDTIIRIHTVQVHDSEGNGGS